MEGRKKKLFEIFSSKRMDKVIWIFFAFSIIFISVIITGITLAMSTATIIDNRRDIALQKIDVVNYSVKNELDTILNLGQGIAMNPLVQQYFSEASSQEYGQLNELRSVMQLVIDGNPNINVIEIFKEEEDNRLFSKSKGDTYMAAQKIMHSYEDATETNYFQTRLLYSNDIIFNEQYTLTLYMPVYSTLRLNKKLGVLAINFSYDLLAQTGNGDGDLIFDIYLLDKAGKYFICESKEQLGKHAPFIEQLKAPEQSTIIDDTLYIRHPVNRWHFTLIGKIKTDDIYRENWKIVLIAIIVVSVVLLVFFFTGSGFIHMMQRLDEAMNTIKREQMLIEKLRFSALQSQIQPHFLYNTLESIHWQVLALRNKELSTMVKALAAYYRIVLSKGADMIPLEQELLHVKNYITIQNLRYDNIIDFEVQVGEQYLAYNLPKITLQPLVENAIYHGIRIEEKRRGKVKISACGKDGLLLLFVENDGKSMPMEEIDKINQSLQDTDISVGYGIHNVNKRLQLEFGSSFGLHYEPGCPNSGGVKVTITLPYR